MRSKHLFDLQFDIISSYNVKKKYTKSCLLSRSIVVKEESLHFICLASSTTINLQNDIAFKFCEGRNARPREMSHRVLIPKLFLS